MIFNNSTIIHKVLQPTDKESKLNYRSFLVAKNATKHDIKRELLLFFATSKIIKIMTSATAVKVKHRNIAINKQVRNSGLKITSRKFVRRTTVKQPNFKKAYVRFSLDTKINI